MERFIRHLLIAWLLLLGSTLLAVYQDLPWLVYELGWLLMLTTPVVAGLLLWLAALRLLQVWRRVRVLWRAGRWRRAPAKPWELDE